MSRTSLLAVTAIAMLGTTSLVPAEAAARTMPTTSARSVAVSRPVSLARPVSMLRTAAVRPPASSPVRSTPQVGGMVGPLHRNATTTIGAPNNAHHNNTTPVVGGLNNVRNNATSGVASNVQPFKAHDHDVVRPAAARAEPKSNAQ